MVETHVAPSSPSDTDEPPLPINTLKDSQCIWTWRQYCPLLFNLSLVVVILCLVLLQMSSSVMPSAIRIIRRASVDASLLLITESHPVDGTEYALYTDRAFVCVQNGRMYQASRLPAQLNASLASCGSNCTHSPTSSAFVMLPRPPPPSPSPSTAAQAKTESESEPDSSLEPQLLEYFNFKCNRIASTIDEMLSKCKKQGYKPVEDYLRIVQGWAAPQQEIALRDTLPILLLMPYDNGEVGFKTEIETDENPPAIYIIPGQDGVMCNPDLAGAYLKNDPNPNPIMSVLGRTAYEKTLQTWFKPTGPSGPVMQNGWYFPRGLGPSRFYAFLSNTKPLEEKKEGTMIGIQGAVDVNLLFEGTNALYDTYTGTQLFCDSSSSSSSSSPLGCEGIARRIDWGLDVSFKFSTLWTQRQIVLDENHQGTQALVVQLKREMVVRYGTVSMMMNFVILAVLVRWSAAMYVLFLGYQAQKCTSWYTGNIGVVSNAKSFIMMPVFLAPHFKFMAITLWACGVHYDSFQLLEALNEAYFVVYLALIEFAFFYFALLNYAAKMTQRRMNDRTFVVLLVGLILLHLVRQPLTRATTKSGSKRTVTSQFDASKYDEVSVSQLFAASTIAEIVGDGTTIFGLKVALLVLPLVDLLLFSTNTRAAMWKHQTKTMEKLHRNKSQSQSQNKNKSIVPSSIEPDKDKMKKKGETVTAGTSSSAINTRRPSVQDLVASAILKGKIHQEALYNIEKALNICVALNGGLGQSVFYGDRGVLGFELVRLGYIEVNGVDLVSFDDFYEMCMEKLALFLRLQWRQHVCMYQLTAPHHVDPVAKVRYVRLTPPVMQKIHRKSFMAVELD